MVQGMETTTAHEALYTALTEAGHNVSIWRDEPGLLRDYANAIGWEAAQAANLEADLKSRWKPTRRQRDAARAMYAARLNRGRDPIYTIHLLNRKQYGFWTTDVEVIALDGVFTDRTVALAALNALVRDWHEANDEPCTGGWTVHWPDSNWAVFEDVLAAYPKTER